MPQRTRPGRPARFAPLLPLHTFCRAAKSRGASGRAFTPQAGPPVPLPRFPSGHSLRLSCLEGLPTLSHGVTGTYPPCVSPSPPRLSSPRSSEPHLSGTLQGPNAHPTVSALLCPALFPSHTQPGPLPLFCSPVRKISPHTPHNIIRSYL